MSPAEITILRQYSGVVGGASALAMNALTMIPSENPIIFTDSKVFSGKPSKYTRFLRYVYRPDVDTKYTNPCRYAPAVLVPTPEKAIVQYIKDNQYEEERLFTSLDTYISRVNGNLSKLYAIAKEYGVEDKTKQLVAETPQWIEEFYSY